MHANSMVLNLMWRVSVELTCEGDCEAGALLGALHPPVILCAAVFSCLLGECQILRLPFEI